MFLFSCPSMGKWQTPALCISSGMGRNTGVKDKHSWWDMATERSARKLMKLNHWEPHLLGVPLKTLYMFWICNFGKISQCFTKQRRMFHKICIEYQTWPTFSQITLNSHWRATWSLFLWYWLEMWDLVGQMEGRNTWEEQKRNGAGVRMRERKVSDMKTVFCWS